MPGAVRSVRCAVHQSAVSSTHSCPPCNGQGRRARWADPSFCQDYSRKSCAEAALLSNPSVFQDYGNFGRHRASKRQIMQYGPSWCHDQAQGECQGHGLGGHRRQGWGDGNMAADVDHQLNKPEVWTSSQGGVCNNTGAMRRRAGRGALDNIDDRAARFSGSFNADVDSSRKGQGRGPQDGSGPVLLRNHSGPRCNAHPFTTATKMSKPAVIETSPFKPLAAPANKVDSRPMMGAGRMVGAKVGSGPQRKRDGTGRHCTPMAPCRADTAEVQEE